MATTLAVLERGAKDLQVFPCNPPTDAESDTLFNRKAVDSARHGRVACARGLTGKPNATPQLTESAAKARRPVACEPGESGESGNLVNLVNLVGWRTSAKLELRLVDVQRLDAMVERGWWHSELRRSP